MIVCFPILMKTISRIHYFSAPMIKEDRLNGLTCFSLCNFDQSGGATIRISGILNALAKKGLKIRFFSKNDQISELSSEISVCQVPEELRELNKRKFQFLLAHFPISFVNKIYRKELNTFKSLFRNNGQAVLFFEYLDISIAYWLWENKVISSYITDVHGINPLEFDLNETNSFKKEIINKIKKLSVLKLDQKIYSNAEKIVYTSEGVKAYMENLYNLPSEKGIVVDESINSLLLQQNIDENLQTEIVRSCHLKEDETIILFAGSFKQLGGIADLIKAYINLKETSPSLKTKLLLIGDGQLFDYCKKLVDQSSVSDEVYFLGRRKYRELKTFQSVVDIIVCPDKDTPYSQILPHIKYFDSLASGKIVINGNFEFSEEINPDEKYSLNFEPSDIGSLTNVIRRAIEDKETLLRKYNKNSKEAIENFNYEQSVTPFFNYLKNAEQLYEIPD